MRILPHHADKFEDARFTLCKITLRMKYTERWGHFDNEYHNKAKKWARAQVGKPLDEVYSTWKKLPWVKPSCRNRESFQRLIHTNVVFTDGELWATSGEWTQIENDYRCNYMYVDPRDGRIKQHKRNKAKPPVKPLDCIIITDYTQLYKEDGIWYHITLPETWTEYKWSWETKSSTVKIHVIPPKMKFEDFKKKYLWSFLGRPKYIKRSASGKLLKKHGVKNDPWKQKQTF